MKRLLFCAILLAGGCDSGKPVPPPPATGSTPPVVPISTVKATGADILAAAERDRSAVQYEQAIKSFTGSIDADPKNAAAYEGRAVARWRISLMRGAADPEVMKDAEAAGDRPRIKALKALEKLVDGARTNGGWEPLAPRILKSLFAKAFPESAHFTTDWVAIVRRPEGELQALCEALAADPDWPIAAGVRAALEGRDVPSPGQEGILWILTALRLPPDEAMKMLESATTPDQGTLMQAQAQLLAAEGKFLEATGRTTIAPLAGLRAASHVAAGKPAAALESLGDEAGSPFDSVVRAAALLQTGTEASLKELAALPAASAIPYLRFEKAIRSLAAGDPQALKDFQEIRTSAGAFTEAWCGLAAWHLNQPGTADLEKVETGKLDDAMLIAVHEAIGFAYLAAGDEEKGAHWLVEGVTRKPSRDLFFRYAPTLRGNRQWKALQALAKAVSRTIPSDPEPWAARAEAFYFLKDYEGAVETVTFATEQKVDPKRLLKWRAYAYEELGKVNEAHDDWGRLAELVPHEGTAPAHRAWMRARMGQWSQVKADAEQGFSRGADAWGLALARFAMAAEALHGPAPEGEEVDPEARKEAAFEHLRIAAKGGAVEVSDIEKIKDVFKPVVDTEEWKKFVEAAAAKQEELKDEAKRSSFLGVMLDHGGGSVAVTGSYRKSGARKAGLASGDIILEVEGRRVNHVGDVGSILGGREPGTEVSLKIERELRPKLKLVQVRKVTLTNRDVFDEAKD